MRIFSYGLAEMCEARIPLRFSIDDAGVEHHGETIGIAPRHFILSSPIELEDGMRLRVKLSLPVESRGASVDLELFAWVVCVSLLHDGRFGCQVELEQH